MGDEVDGSSRRVDAVATVAGVFEAYCARGEYVPVEVGVMRDGAAHWLAVRDGAVTRRVMVQVRPGDAETAVRMSVEVTDGARSLRREAGAVTVRAEQLAEFCAPSGALEGMVWTAFAAAEKVRVGELT